MQPGIQGSSGIEVRNLSNLFLNDSTGHPVKFLSSLGRQLNRIGPRVEIKLKRIVCKAAGACEFRALTKHSLPSLG